MLQRFPRFFFTIAIFILTVIWLVLGPSTQVSVPMSSSVKLLTDPFLQLPTHSSVRVVWFTEFAGIQHTVAYGPNLEQSVLANTTKLSRMREDQNSKIGSQTKDGQIYQKPVARNIWRHEAIVTQLKPGQRIPYRVTSVREGGQSVSSETFTLAPKPAAGQPLKILLTSDHQLKPMVPANLQKVVETIKPVDAVFFAGDLVNIPDRASEWFDDNQGNAFFPTLQGHADYELEKQGIKTRYTGGALIQSAPMYSAIGNHEVMGRFSTERSLKEQYEDGFPQSIVEKQASNKSSLDQTWLKNQSYNTDSYEEIFTLPESRSGGKQYYAVTFGDIRLVVLYATNLWRTPSPAADAKGKYQERQQDFNHPQNWGHGQIVFEQIAKGSPQYNWLQQELNSSDFQQAKYKVVMLHHPPHSLGENVVPPYTDPVQRIERNDRGQIKTIRYEYPQSDDYLIRDVIPLLEKAGVQLVFYGHSHLWNRFVSLSGIHFLETSNVGNSYGAFVGNQRRTVPKDSQLSYAAIGNPNGLEPAIPTIGAERNSEGTAPLTNEAGQPLPYIASNDVTIFSILDTSTGTVSSYRFDTRNPKSGVVKFDEFKLEKSGQREWAMPQQRRLLQN